MLRFLIKRILFAVFVTWVIATAVFALFFIANPGDTAQSFAGKNATPEQVTLVRERLGLDRPKMEQYVTFITGAARGDLGVSFVNQEPVLNTILSRLPVTASLTLGAAAIWLLLGIPIGVLAATRPRSLRDRAATIFALAGLSIPTFVLGLLLLYLLFYLPTVNGLPIFPGSGYVPLSQNPWEWARHLILPWLTVALVSAATYSRITRGSLLEVLGEDYVRTARAKGLGERRVVYRHALRSAVTPIVTILGVDIGALLGGAIVTEAIFGLPGIGQAAIRSVIIGDLPTIMGTVLFAAVFIVVANIVVDIAYALLDPRVRLS
jgi:peptide/nickel transport system permease protein